MADPVQARPAPTPLSPTSDRVADASPVHRAEEGPTYALWHFVTHVLVSGVLFIVVGAAAVGLHEVVGWLEVKQLPEFMVFTTRWLSYLLFGTDVAMFVVYNGKATQALMRRLWKATY